MKPTFLHLPTGRALNLAHFAAIQPLEKNPGAVEIVLGMGGALLIDGEDGAAILAWMKAKDDSNGAEHFTAFPPFFHSAQVQ